VLVVRTERERIFGGSGEKEQMSWFYLQYRNKASGENKQAEKVYYVPYSTRFLSPTRFWCQFTENREVRNTNQLLMSD
jgi:hypothetical protein